MRDGWSSKALGEVCVITPQKGEVRDRLSADALVSFLPMENLGIDKKYLCLTQTKPLSSVVGSYTYFADGDVLLAKITPCFENGKLGIAKGLTNGVGFGSSEYIVFRPDSSLTKEWLYYYLSREEFRVEGMSRMAGAVGHKRVAKEFIEHYPIPVPPIAEQQRIVLILDQVLENIAIAEANTEQNLQSARALFESRLQDIFNRNGDGWLENRKPLADHCELIVDCEHKTAATQKEGIPSIRTPNIGKGKLILEGVRCVSEDTYRQWTRRAAPAPGDLILAREATAGNVAVIPKGLRVCLGQRTVLIRPNRKVFEPEFLALVLLQPRMQKTLLAHSRGATVQHVNMKDIRALNVGLIPPLSVQREIVSVVGDASAESERLESLYEQKLATLKTLRASLLHYAFTDQLTAKQSIQRQSTAVPYPATVPGVTTTDLHAGILAMAFAEHERKGKLKLFTHVKAEKIAHMVEAYLGIDMGRLPVKDAAGPNDFRHLKKVEHRAMKANYFDFKLVGIAYRVQRLPGFERLILKTRTILGDRLTQVELLLTWMLRMDVQQAEIVATVFAAWNNLLMDGKQPTDEQIVFEARENWHSDKLRIERPRFFHAIAWLREEGVVPQGKGRRVGDKGR